jgi:hypothetical protein
MVTYDYFLILNFKTTSRKDCGGPDRLCTKILIVQFKTSCAFAKYTFIPASLPLNWTGLPYLA